MQIELDIMERQIVATVVRGRLRLLTVEYEEVVINRYAVQTIIASQISDCKSILRKLEEQVE